MAASILLTRKEMFIGVIVRGKRREVIKLWWWRIILKSRKKFKIEKRDSRLL
jgi:hypothetical protein